LSQIDEITFQVSSALPLALGSTPPSDAAGRLRACRPVWNRRIHSDRARGRTCVGLHLGSSPSFGWQRCRSALAVSRPRKCPRARCARVRTRPRLRQVQAQRSAFADARDCISRGQTATADGKWIV